MDEHLELLKEYKFQKYLNKLNKKLKNKKIVLYGAGKFFEAIKQNYDLSGLNIIGISDRKYKSSDEGNLAFGYKIIPFNRIIDYKPDCILISTLLYMSILRIFRKEEFSATKINIYPLVDKPFGVLLKEII